MDKYILKSEIPDCCNRTTYKPILSPISDYYNNNILSISNTLGCDILN